MKTAVAMSGGAAAVPAFQRQGYLEKLGHTRLKWFKRFFVLRDSFLLAYNLQKSDYTVEPRAAIHLGNSNVTLCEHNGKVYCFMIETTQKDKFLFSAETPEDRDAWIMDVRTGGTVTHASMVKLAVENSCLAEEKGAGAVARDNSTSALAIFSNEEYIQNTPITGGAEGWLRTAGFNPDEERPNASASFKEKFKSGGKKELSKCYFILRDSHLLMFNGGDVLTKPRGVMFLLGTNVVVHNEKGGDGDYHFSVRSPECGDEIELIASSNKIRTRWCQALRVGSRVTFPDLKLLQKEHALLAAVTMTPRAAPVMQNFIDQGPMADDFMPILTTTDVDIQGEQLDPGVQQAYDAEGNPIVRNPDGKLVTFQESSGDEPVLAEIAPATPRFNASGQQLDPFNRALPPGAVPMFTNDGVPIGVGPDGQHYLPDGTVVAPDAAHFDVDGKTLASDKVKAADAISQDLNVAIKVRTKLKGDGTTAEAVDALGRTFRDGYDEKSMDGAQLIKNADGDMVPLASARRIEAGTGNLQDADAAVAAAAAKREAAEKAAEQQLTVMVEDEDGEEKELGKVEVEHNSTLANVRTLIQADIELDFPDFVFLFNGVPMLRYEERDRLAVACLPEVFIRGKELKKVAPKKFTKKVQQLNASQEAAAEVENEFMAMMRRVREGKHLKNTKQAFMED